MPYPPQNQGQSPNRKTIQRKPMLKTRQNQRIIRDPPVQMSVDLNCLILHSCVHLLLQGQFITYKNEWPSTPWPLSTYWAAPPSTPWTVLSPGE